MFRREWWNINDCTAMWSPQHKRNHLMRHHRHCHNIDIDFIHYPFIRNGMKVTDVRYSNVVNQNGDVQSFKLLENFVEKIRVLRFSKVNNNKFGLNVFLFIDVFNFIECLFHLLLISGNHADVKAQFSQLFAKTKSNAITGSCDNCPSIWTISFNKVFGGDDKFDEVP